MTQPRITFGNSHELLLLNSYAPIPLGDNGTPMGPVYVMQIDWTRHAASAEAQPAVLTACPRLQGPPPAGSPLIADVEQTYLATISVAARSDLWAEVDAIVGVGPVRIGEDGTRLYVFAFNGAGMLEGAGTSYAAELDGFSARASGGNGFIPLDGEWPRGNLLQTMRSDLPTLDADTARAMVDALDELFDKHIAPATPSFSTFKPTPLPSLKDGERVTFGNARAMDTLKRHNYDTCPVDWGDTRPSSAWINTATFGVQWEPSTRAMGVALYCQLDPRTRGERSLCTVEIFGRADLVAAVDAAITSRLGASPARVSSDGTRLRIFRGSGHDVLRAAQHHLSPRGPFVAGSSVRVHFASAGSVVVVSGLDSAGQPYKWENGDPLTVARDALPEIGQTMVESWLLRDIEAALQSPAPARESVPTRGRKRG